MLQTDSRAFAKLATMIKDSPNIGPGEITLKEDPPAAAKAHELGL
ncbi:hypothetical protein HH1059_03630 [Halorhodospira halochloris]|uniref:Uncharacterized protein n=1 Tax=Halorhodospira halochloris TaxID=1052 RepID=A0A2Z6EZF0_HALHR|nr:hypothetical protein HH1059_03630 [Halorhodospira halochloris]